MGLAATLAPRSLRRSPGRSFFTVAGVAVGVATVVAVFTLDHNTVEGLRARYSKEWRPELEVRPNRDLEDPGAELQRTPGVAESAAFFQNAVRLQGPNAERVSVLLAVEGTALAAMDAYRLVAGRSLEDGQPEVLLGAPLAEALGVEAGDPLVLSPPPRGPQHECVDGVRQIVEKPNRPPPLEIEFTVAGILAREKLGRRADGEVAIVDYFQGRELYRETRIDERWWVRRNPSVDVEKLQTSLSRSFAYDTAKSVLVGAMADERAFRNGVRMAGLFALVLGLYVVFHTLSMSLVERVREVATLHALGCSRLQVARVFFLEALILSVTGGLLGMAAGLGLAHFLLQRGITTLGSGRHLEFFEIPWASATALAAAGTVVALLGSVYPLLRARRANTVVALRGEQTLASSAFARGFHTFAVLLLVGLLPALYFVIVPVVGETSGALVGAILAAVGILGLFIAVPLVVPSLVAAASRAITGPFERRWPFSGAMAARSIREDRRRIAVATSALALVVAAFVGLKGMTASLRGEIEDWAAGAIENKLFVSGLPDVSFTSMNQSLSGLPGVRGVESGNVRTYVSFQLRGLSIEGIAGFGPLADDPALVRAMREGRGAVVTERLARHLGYEVGDRFPVPIGRGRERSFEILAISDAYGYFPHPDERMFAVVSDHHLEQDFCLDIETTDRLSVTLEPGTDTEAVRATLVAALSGDGPGSRGLFLESGVELRDKQVADVDQDFFLFDVILGLTALLAGLGVLNGQLLSALERSKEIGVLRALGTARSQVAGMVLLESLATGVLGGALGLGLGSALGPVIVTALESLSGLELTARGAGAWLAICFLGSIALAVTAGLYPIWRMNHADAVRAVRTG